MGTEIVSKSKLFKYGVYEVPNMQIIIKTRVDFKSNLNIVLI